MFLQFQKHCYNRIYYSKKSRHKNIKFNREPLLCVQSAASFYEINCCLNAAFPYAIFLHHKVARPWFATDILHCRSRLAAPCIKFKTQNHSIPYRPIRPACHLQYFILNDDKSPPPLWAEGILSQHYIPKFTIHPINGLENTTWKNN